MDFYFDFLLFFPHPIANNVVADICFSTLLCFIRISFAHTTFRLMTYIDVQCDRAHIECIAFAYITTTSHNIAELNYRFYRPLYARSMRVHAHRPQSTCSSRLSYVSNNWKLVLNCHHHRFHLWFFCRAEKWKSNSNPISRQDKWHPICEQQRKSL